MLLLCMNTSSNDMHLTKDEMLSYADVKYFRFCISCQSHWMCHIAKQSLHTTVFQLYNNYKQNVGKPFLQ